MFLQCTMCVWVSVCEFDEGLMLLRLMAERLLYRVQRLYHVHPPHEDGRWVRM